MLVSIRGDQDVNEVKLNNELVKIAADYQAKTLLSLKVPDRASSQNEDESHPEIWFEFGIN